MIEKLSMCMTDRIVNSNGIKIYYRIQRGKGHPLVFLHGGGGSLSACVKLEYVDSNNISIINAPEEIYQRIARFLS